VAATHIPPSRNGPREDHDDDRARADRLLFDRFVDDRDPTSRDAVVERFLPLARQLALRYDGPSHAFEDVFQVACLALVKAVDRFDPDRGVAFSSYAVPTVVGELKRYFRDQTWAVHVPRDLQERSLRAGRAVSVLGRRLGRRPTVPDLARHLGWPDDEVLDALRVTAAYRAASLEAPHRSDGDDDAPLGEAIGYDDERFGAVERRADLWKLLGRLSARERAALWLRFGHDLTQTEIADVLGVPPLQVARILRRALERLRRLDARAAA
jgi:RNA polymerase sigma-B factor